MHLLIRRQLTIAVVTSLLFALLLLAIRFVAHPRGIHLDALLRDPNGVSGAPFYVGVLSMVGILGWGAAASAGAVGWSTLHAERDPELRRLALALGGFAILSIVLGLDDLAQFHEDIAPKFLGVDEKLVFSVYGIYAVAWAVTFRRLLLDRVPVLLPAAVLGFASSILIDLIGDKVELPMFLEDSPKLLGIYLWALTGGALLTSAYRDALARARADGGAAAAGDARTRSPSPAPPPGA